MTSLLLKVLPDSATQKLTAAFFRFQAWRTVGTGSHSIEKHLEFANMDVKILPALQDNYMYLIIDKTTRDAAIIDPVDPERVIAAVEREKVNLKQVLTTHHHWDHAGGNTKLVQTFKSHLDVYGGDDRIESLTNKVKHNDTFKIGMLNVECLHTPCHTTGHICYNVTSNDNESAVFTGDTLFLGGCGRFFEGTPTQMYSALINILSKLPDETKVFCGHEYSLQNLAFGAHVEPNNVEIQEKIKWAKQQREENQPTVPSTIGEEKRINPFMRVLVKDVQDHAGKLDGIDVMGAIRKEKDSFKA